MIKKLILCISGLVVGVILGGMLFSKNKLTVNSIFTKPSPEQQKEKIGFLPYWLLDKTSGDYKKYFTTLTYFGLTLDTDGKILKFTKPGESEPGWYALEGGKFDEALNNFKNSGGKLSLLVFAGKPNDINLILENPSLSADNLNNEIMPIISKYGFSDINLDIEDTADASPSARDNFTQFVSEIKKATNGTGITLTVEISPTDIIKNRLIDVNEIAKIADKIVVMGYDYHFIGSYVTGPVGPLYGAESNSEFDVNTAIKLMSGTVSAGKIILGVPIYGYEWETLFSNPRSAVIPGTGVVASDKTVEQKLQNCNDCQLQWDNDANEAYFNYQDDITKTYHQIFYPNKQAMQAKVDYMLKNKLGGIAVWALGYEDSNVLNPLEGDLLK